MKIINVMAMSLDGRIGAFPFEPDAHRFESGISCAYDRKIAMAEVFRADLVVVGANTLRASREAWSVVNDRGRVPPWVILTTKGIDPNLPFWGQEEITRVLVSPQLLYPEPFGGTNLVCGAENPARFTIDWARAQGLDRVLVFGGGHVNGMFFKEDLVDELKITLAPCLIGRTDAPSLVQHVDGINARLSLMSSQIVDHYVFLHYAIIRH